MKILLCKVLREENEGELCAGPLPFSGCVHAAGEGLLHTCLLVKAAIQTLLLLVVTVLLCCRGLGALRRVVPDPG